MAIMFKKTVVILFLLSQVLASSTGPTGKPKPVKTTKRSPKPVEVRMDNTKTTAMNLRPKKPSPLSITEISSGPKSSSKKSSGVPVEAKQSSSAATELVHFVPEDEDDFDLLDFEEEARPTLVFESLIAAIRSGDINSLRSLVGSNAFNLNSLEKAPLSPFMIALQTGKPEVVDFLLGTGKIDPNVISVDGVDVLTLAAESLGMEFVAKIINGEQKLTSRAAFTILTKLKRQANDRHLFPIIDVMANSDQFNLKNALFVFAFDAVCENRIDLVRLLHSRGIPMISQLRGLYFIHNAAVRGYTEMVNLLLEFGTPVDILTEGLNHLSAMQVSFFSFNYDVTAELIRKGAAYGLTDCISAAILHNNIQIVDALLSTYSNLTHFFLEDGFNLITFAIAADKPQILQMILDSGKVSLTAADQFGRSIYNMELNENASEAVKAIVRAHQESISEFKELFNDFEF